MGTGPVLDSLGIYRTLRRCQRARQSNLYLIRPCDHAEDPICDKLDLSPFPIPLPRAALTPNGKRLITASENRLASWDVASGDLLAEDRSQDGRNFVYLLENGTQLITGNSASVEMRKLTYFEVLHTFQQRRDLSPPGLPAMVGDVAIHPSGADSCRTPGTAH